MADQDVNPFADTSAVNPFAVRTYLHTSVANFLCGILVEDQSSHKLSLAIDGILGLFWSYQLYLRIWTRLLLDFSKWIK